MKRLAKAIFTANILALSAAMILTPAETNSEDRLYTIASEHPPDSFTLVSTRTTTNTSVEETPERFITDYNEQKDVPFSDKSNYSLDPRVETALVRELAQDAELLIGAEENTPAEEQEEIKIASKQTESESSVKAKSEKQPKVVAVKPKPEPEPKPKPISEEKSTSLKDVQRRLHELGYQPGPVDGITGWRTERAVRWFQATAKIQVDGVVGPQTETKLFASNAPRARASTKPTRTVSQSAQRPSGSIASMIYQVFGSEGAKALRVAKCESTLNPRAHNPRDPHTGSYGLFQINGVHFLYSNSMFYGHSVSDFYDPAFNIRAAHKLWRSSGWGIWGCGHA